MELASKNVNFGLLRITELKDKQGWSPWSWSLLNAVVGNIHLVAADLKSDR